jgi:hypothetical protein
MLMCFLSIEFVMGFRSYPNRIHGDSSFDPLSRGDSQDGGAPNFWGVSLKVRNQLISHVNQCTAGARADVATSFAAFCSGGCRVAATSVDRCGSQLSRHF